MHPHRIARAQQCPRPGCDAWALLATPEEVADGGEPLWRCSRGHEGARVLTGSADGGVRWSDRPSGGPSDGTDPR